MTDAPHDPEALESDPPLNRTISPIAGRPVTGRRGKALLVLGLAAGCGAFALAGAHPPHRKPRAAPEQPARQVVAFEPAEAPPTLAAPGPDAPHLTKEGPEPRTPDASETETSPPRAQRRPDPLSAIRGAPLLAFSGAAHPGGPAYARAEPDEPATTLSGDADPRGASAVGVSRARRLGDRSFLILAGTSIPCVLQTAMDSATPGYVACVLPQDVWSENGAAVLLEKGSKVLGEYRSGLKSGQTRLFVLWTRAVTPNGIAVDLASPATDALGRAGFDGDLDRRFWERFGGALLLSVVDDATAAVAVDHHDAETLRVPSDAAGIALGHSVDLPPVLRKPPGADVAIFAARDFDFSAVYALKVR